MNRDRPKFAEELKTELEATSTEDISIYFEENPHDGLLEIHNVDKCLDGKLRSLINENGSFQSYRIYRKEKQYALAEKPGWFT